MVIDGEGPRRAKQRRWELDSSRRRMNRPARPHERAAQLNPRTRLAEAGAFLSAFPIPLILFFAALNLSFYREETAVVHLVGRSRLLPRRASDHWAKVALWL